MKITVEKQALNEAVINLLIAVSKKSNIPALEGIFLKTNENILILTAFDLEIGIKTQISANISIEGEIILPAKIFSEMVRKISSEKIEIKTDENLKASLSGDKTEFSIIGISASEFPALPSVSGERSFKIESGKFKSMIRQTIFSVAVVDYRPIYTGSKIIIKDNVLTIVSLDNNRLALRREVIDFSGDFSFVVPGKTLNEIMRLLNDDDSKILIMVEEKNIRFQINNFVVISRLLSGEFIDFNTILPTTHTQEVSINTRSFMESLDRVSILVADKIKVPVKFVIDENIIKLSCVTTVASAYDEVECTTKGESVTLGFNNRYLLEAIRGAESDQVVLKIKSESSPMLIVPKEGDSFLFLVGPMRIKAIN